MPLGLALAVGACDVAALLSDPYPRFEQTWNLPADSTTISVASLLPPSVSIYSTPASAPPDSSAFRLNIGLVSFARRVGDDCAPCQALNGQTTTKPAFIIATGSTTTLPADVVSGSLLGGQVVIQVTNNFSFDPLRVKTGPGAQGHLVLLVRSGSLVVGKDSINGADVAFAPGAVLTRPITLQTGLVTGSIGLDLTLNSPVGDHNETINANGMLNGAATVPDLRFAQVRVNVVNQTLLSPGTDSIALDGIDPSITDHVVSGGLEMTISNPFAVTGTVSVRFDYGTLPSEAISKTLSLPTGVAQVRSVTLDSAEISNLFGQKVGFTVMGGVNSSSPIDVTPKQVVTIANRLILKIRTGGGEN